MIFTVLLDEEAQEIGVHADWSAEVALTPEMLIATNCPARTDIARKGRLLKPLILGPQMIPAGNAVFMDSSGMYYIES
jgi:hypothetical protein